MVLIFNATTDKIQRINLNLNGESTHLILVIIVTSLMVLVFVMELVRAFKLERLFLVMDHSLLVNGLT